MHNPLIESLSRTGSYSEKELMLLEKELRLRELKKDEILLNKGEVCSSLCFIISGALYQYEIDSDMNKSIIDLNVANEWVLNHKSFTLQKASEYYIRSYENTSVYELTIESIHKLIALSQAFLQMGKILEHSVSRIDFFDRKYIPDEKYLHLMENRPELIRKFPQKLIASFLKITPETLSRVRNRFSKG